jgi:NRAMP (natural resistance-associated macrophage protein)-like metal ion transporter
MAGHHPRRARLRGRGYFRNFGPGLVTGAADDDPAGIGTYSQIGATLRYDLLWTVPFSLPLTIAVVELAARTGLVTDRGLATVIRERFSRTVAFPIFGLVIVANTFNIGADLNAMAASVRLLVPAPQWAGVLTLAIAITVLEVAVPYRRYAVILRWLVVSLMAYVGVLAVVHVPWGEVARYTFVPAFTANRETLTALIAIFGTTISPYLFFWQAAEEMEENDETPSTVTKVHVRRMRADVIAGVVAAHLIMFAIIVATAATLGHAGTQIGTADEAARALRPLAGDWAGLLFAMGILGTGLLAVPTLAGSSAYTTAEMFNWREGLSKPLRQAPSFYAVIVIGMLAGAALNVVGVPPIKALFASAVLNGLAAPPILLLTVLAGRSEAALGRWRSGWLSLLLVWSTVAVMTVLPVWFLLL